MSEETNEWMNEWKTVGTHYTYIKTAISKHPLLDSNKIDFKKLRTYGFKMIKNNNWPPLKA